MRNKKNSFRKKDSVEDELYLDSWSGLEEYLRFAPKLIELIELRSEKDELQWTRLSSAYPECKSTYKLNSELETAFRAKVKINPVEEIEFFERPQKEKDLIIVLDQVSDTRNLGAIARSAAYFGVEWLLMPKDRQASVSSASLRAAQGAFSIIRPVYVTNLARCLDKLKQEGYWILGADMKGQEIRGLDVEYDKKVLVLGSEAKGLRQLTRKHCDLMISVQGAKGSLESLNVSVASGILIHELAVR